MRLSLIGLSLALTSGVAVAATCVRPAERSALDVEGLKSQLMVTALACGRQAQYNAFVSRYKPDLATTEKELSGYFARTYGRAGQRQQDQYVTQLANGESEEGVKQGSLFCDQNGPTFDEVMALRGGAELPDYAAGKALPQVISSDECATPVRAERVTARRAAHRVKKK